MRDATLPTVRADAIGRVTTEDIASAEVTVDVPGSITAALGPAAPIFSRSPVVRVI
jgi:hypothetical protein